MHVFAIAFRSVVAFLFLTAGLHAAPPVEFELLAEQGVALTAQHEWLAVFKDLDQAGLRIRSVASGDKPTVEKVGSGKNVSYRVTGIITAANTLRLPGATFRSTDKRGLQQWLEKLKVGGEENLTAKVGAFGLTSKQLVEVHAALAGRVAFETAGQRVDDVVRKIAAKVTPPPTIDAGAQQALAGGETVADELQGLSSGTALAAALRPLGLILVPEKGRGLEVKLRITDVRQSDQSWPVGWPSEKNMTETVPQLLKFLNVEIDKTPLDEALPALQERLAVPFLIDHNSLARQRIDLTKARVSLPTGKTFYAKILDRILAQAKLSWEIRVDEAEQPFLWISSKAK